jgi:hypothetical protein
MSAGRLVVVIRGDEIVVTQPGSNFSAVYYKPRDEPQLIAKGAWQAANDKVASLGGLRRAGPPRPFPLPIAGLSWTATV